MHDALQKNKTHLVTFGGAFSNHIIAVACAGYELGLTTTAFIRGEQVENPVLNQCQKWGMNLIFVSRDSYKNKPELFEKYFHNNTRAYFIDEGGKGELAAKGCEEILDEVYDFTYAVCAVGTGTTLAGLARAAKSKAMKAEGICVLKGAESLNGEVKSLAGFDVTIHHGFHRGGYAKTDDELIKFIRNFNQYNAFWLDQVYTAKTMMAIIELVREGYYKKGDRILMIHTGGLTGNTALPEANTFFS